MSAATDDAPRYQAGHARQLAGGHWVWMERVTPLGKWIGRGLDYRGCPIITRHYERRGDALRALDKLLPGAELALGD